MITVFGGGKLPRASERQAYQRALEKSQAAMVRA